MFTIKTWEWEFSDCWISVCSLLDTTFAGRFPGRLWPKFFPFMRILDSDIFEDMLENFESPVRNGYIARPVSCRLVIVSVAIISTVRNTFDRAFKPTSPEQNNWNHYPKLVTHQDWFVCCSIALWLSPMPVFRSMHHLLLAWKACSQLSCVSWEVLHLLLTVAYCCKAS